MSNFKNRNQIICRYISEIYTCNKLYYIYHLCGIRTESFIQRSWSYTRNSNREVSRGKQLNSWTFISLYFLLCRFLACIFVRWLWRSVTINSAIQTQSRLYVTFILNPLRKKHTHSHLYVHISNNSWTFFRCF